MDTASAGSGFESPHGTYSRAVAQNREKLGSQQRWDKTLGIAKLAAGIFVIFLLVRFVHELHGFRLVLIPVVLFVVLAVVHERVLTRIRTLKSLIAFYERGLARLEDRWAGTGESGDRFIHETHPYARDLDVFGRGSLFELLCISRTRAGAETLARWLQEPAPPEDVSTRQEAVRELRDRSEFRERLFTAGERVSIGVHPESLAAWGERKRTFASLADTILLVALAVLWIGSVAYGVLYGSYWPLLAISVLNFIVYGQFKKRMAESVATIEAATTGLDLLAEILGILEAEQFQSPRLRDLKAALQSDGVVPSSAVKKLDRITHFLEQLRNPIVLLLDYFLF